MFGDALTVDKDVDVSNVVSCWIAAAESDDGLDVSLLLILLLSLIPVPGMARRNKGSHGRCRYWFLYLLVLVLSCTVP